MDVIPTIYLYSSSNHYSRRKKAMMAEASTIIMALLVLVKESLGTLHELTSNISIIFLKPSSAPQERKFLQFFDSNIAVSL